MDRIRDAQEAINYQDVLQYITELVQGLAIGQEPLVLTEDIFQAISARTLFQTGYHDERGRFRSVQVEVPGRLMPPPPEQVPGLMKDLVREANELLVDADPLNPALHPVMIAAWVMWRSLQIHPFIEGNGRTSRALATLILMHFGYLGIPTQDKLRPVKSLEWFFDANRKRYADTLTAADKGNSGPWYLLFSMAVNTTMSQIQQETESAAATDNADLSQGL